MIGFLGSEVAVTGRRVGAPLSRLAHDVLALHTNTEVTRRVDDQARLHRRPDQRLSFRPQGAGQDIGDDQPLASNAVNDNSQMVLV